MRFIFFIVVLIHGIIHLLGFIKAFFETDISIQLVGVSKPIGSIWLVAFLLFMVVAIQFLTGEKWFYIAFIAVFVSQILIVLAWQDAKFATIANIIILIVGFSAFATHKFHNMVTYESYQILLNKTIKPSSIILEKDINHLPQIIQKWLNNSRTVGSPNVQTVQLKQLGTMRTKPTSHWMPFEASQVFNVENPSYVWQTKVDAMPIISMVGLDKFENGKGEMLIKLAGLMSVVNEVENPKINQGAMLRYLAEICWFPSAALNDYIHWESVDSNSAKATFMYKNQSVSGLFTFNNKGDFVTFEANRYFGGSKTSQLEKWRITAEDYKVFNGIKIPSKCKVTWKLKEGDFNWMNLQIVAIDYNSLSSH